MEPCASPQPSRLFSPHTTPKGALFSKKGNRRPVLAQGDTVREWSILATSRVTADDLRLPGSAPASLSLRKTNLESCWLGQKHSSRLKGDERAHSRAKQE